MGNIKLIVYDFDGVMTDNKVYVNQNGNEMVQVNRADGPAAFCWWNKRARSLTFNMITPSACATTEKFFQCHGLELGSQLKPVFPLHRIVWEEDNYNVLVREFEKMCGLIEEEK